MMTIFDFLLKLTLCACIGVPGHISNEENSGRIIRSFKQPIPIEDFFRNPDKIDFQLSPDGKYFSFMAPVNGRMNIFVQHVRGGKSVQVTNSKDRSIAKYIWANKQQLLYQQDKGGNENYVLYAVDLDGTNNKMLTDEQADAKIVGLPMSGETDVLIKMNKRTPKVYDLYKLNLNTGKHIMVAQNPGNFISWIQDGKGKVLLAIALDGTRESIMFRETEVAPWRSILTHDIKETVTPRFFSSDNKKFYALSNIGRDKVAAVLIDVKTGKETKVIYENKEYDVGDIERWEGAAPLGAISYLSWKMERHFLDQDYQMHYENIMKQFDDNVDIFFEGGTANGTKKIVRTTSDKNLGSYYLYDVSRKHMVKLADIAPFLDTALLAATTPITFRTRDNLLLHGYLTLPVNVPANKARKLPVVLQVHGGPWSRDHWTYNPMNQYLASRGYAVLQVNFRGSTGYGRKLKEASFKEWGLAMQDDLTDAVQWLIANGIADPRRVAIIGASYGGYAALMGVVKNPDLYCAAVDIVGISNLFTFLRSFPPQWEVQRSFWDRAVGDPNNKADSTRLFETSPAKHVQKIKTPLLIAQGANDPRVNRAESDQMVKALKNNGKEVEYMLKENEGHGFSNQENVLELTKAIAAFLDKHMNPAETVE